jgi:hypothetical protein
VARNLEGALERLRQAADADVALPAGFRLDALIADVDTRLDRARSGVATTPTALPWSR